MFVEIQLRYSPASCTDATMLVKQETINTIGVKREIEMPMVTDGDARSLSTLAFKHPEGFGKEVVVHRDTMEGAEEMKINHKNTSSAVLIKNLFKDGFSK
jgi:hypothetical protein